MNKKLKIALAFQSIVVLSLAINALTNRPSKILESVRQDNILMYKTFSLSEGIDTNVTVTKEDAYNAIAASNQALPNHRGLVEYFRYVSPIVDTLRTEFELRDKNGELIPSFAEYLAIKNAAANKETQEEKIKRLESELSKAKNQ